MYPAIGIGGMQLNLIINNRGGTDLTFGQMTIPAQSEADFTLPTATLDLHVAVRRLLLPGGGPAVGVEIGYTYGLQEIQWRNAATDQPVPGPAEAGRLSHFYLKFN